MDLELIKLYLHQCLVFDSILQLCKLLSLGMWVKDIGEYFVLFFFATYYKSNISIKIKKVELELEGSCEDI